MIQKSILLTCCLLATASLSAENADDKQGKKVTVLVEGAHCDACVSAIRKTLAAVKGIKLEPDDVYRGEKPKYFSDPLVIRLGKKSQTGLGALAKATAKAKTPHAGDVPPRLHLVLFTEQTIDEPSVSELRTVLSETNGVVVYESGGLGAVPQKGWYWIRLDPAGGANLKEILTAAKKATKYQLLDPSDR